MLHTNLNANYSRVINVKLTDAGLGTNYTIPKGTYLFVPIYLKAPAGEEVSVNLYDSENITIWGYTGSAGYTYLYNITYDFSTIQQTNLYIYADGTNAKIRVTTTGGSGNGQISFLLMRVA